MKNNFKKIICIALSCCMLSGLVQAVSADTVNNDEQKAIEYLISQGIIAGDEFGNVMESDPIQREQMVSLIGRIGLFSSDRTEGLEKYFTDSNEVSDWAYSYVLEGVEAAYIDGYPDGTFKPKNYMTYAEAIKFATAAFANVVGTDSAEYMKVNYKYPDDYILVADQKGYLSNIGAKFRAASWNEYMPRGDVFMLLYNIYIDYMNYSLDNAENLSDYIYSEKFDENTENNIAVELAGNETKYLTSDNYDDTFFIDFDNKGNKMCVDVYYAEDEGGGYGAFQIHKTEDKDSDIIYTYTGGYKTSNYTIIGSGNEWYLQHIATLSGAVYYTIYEYQNTEFVEIASYSKDHQDYMVNNQTASADEYQAMCEKYNERIYASTNKQMYAINSI